MNLPVLLDYFISPQLKKNADHKLLLNSRILVGISIMFGGSMILTMFLLLLLAFLDIIVVWPAIISCSLSSSCYIFQIFYFRKTGNHALSATITMTVLSMFTSGFTYFTGGWESPLIFFLFVIPLVAFLVTGYRAGMLWTLLVIIVYAGFGLLESSGIKAPHVIEENYQALLEYFTWIFSWTMIVGAVTLYSSTVNTLNIFLNSEKEKLRQKAIYDEESGAYSRKAFNKLFFSREGFSQSSTAGDSASFALVLVEILPAWKIDIATEKDLILHLVRAFENSNFNSITLSRYGKLSVTALITGLDDSSSTQERLYDLYQHLVKSLSGKEVEICFGAVTAPTDYKDLAEVTTEARSALQNSKYQTQKFLAISKSKHKKRDYNVMDLVTVASYSDIMKRA